MCFSSHNCLFSRVFRWLALNSVARGPANRVAGAATIEEAGDGDGAVFVFVTVRPTPRVEHAQYTDFHDEINAMQHLPEPALGAVFGCAINQIKMSTVRMGNHRSSVPCVYIKYHQHVECKAQWQLLRGWRSLIQENFQQVYNQEFGIVISSLGQHTVEISSEQKRWFTHKLRRASKIVWNTNFDSISNVGECSNSRWSWTNC